MGRGLQSQLQLKNQVHAESKSLSRALLIFQLLRVTPGSAVKKPAPIIEQDDYQHGDLMLMAKGAPDVLLKR